MFRGRTSQTQSWKPSVRSASSSEEAAGPTQSQRGLSSSEQRRSCGSNRSTWRRDSCSAAAQEERVSHLSPPGPSHRHASLTPPLCCRSGGRQRWTVSGRRGRRPGRNGSGVGSGGRGQREHQRGGRAHGADWSRYRGKIKNWFILLLKVRRSPEHGLSRVISSHVRFDPFVMM